MDKPRHPITVTCCKGMPPLSLIRAAAIALRDNRVHGGGPSFHVEPKIDSVEMETPIKHLTPRKKILGGQRPARRKK